MMDETNKDVSGTPMTNLARELEEASLATVKKCVRFSPNAKESSENKPPTPGSSRAPLSLTPLTSRRTYRRSESNSLLQSGLRVSTPTGRCGRRFSTFDENSPGFRSPSTYTVVVRQRNLLLEDDASSQDSAFSEGSFRFLPPSGFAPKKTDSPRRCLKFSSESLSTDSGISEDGWSELPCVSEDDLLPEGLGSLLSASLTTPNRRKRRSSPQGSGTAKRAKPLSDRASRENRASTPASEKKGTLFEYGFTKNKPPLVKAHSDSEIKMALQRSTKESLIGDFSRPHALPLVSPGKHVDLKSISSDTLAKLMAGDFNDQIASYKIIDCRYPYEFEGGHIRGAQNLYTCEDIRQELLKVEPAENDQDENGKRHILIFHCEFSSERGPFLSRFLRKEDRNSHTYPSLAYPELYLLHGGYSTFFKSHKDLCEPQSYRQMEDPAHTSELRHFKAKSKTWAPGSHKKLAIRSLSRLGF